MCHLSEGALERNEKKLHLKLTGCVFGAGRG